METRYVTVPSPTTVSIENPMTGKTVSAERDLEQLVKERTNDSGHFGKTLDQLMLGFSIRQSFLGCKPGDVIGMALKEWELLCASLREPTSGYNPEVMFQLLPMVRSILDAPTTDPRKSSIDLDKTPPQTTPSGN